MLTPLYTTNQGQEKCGDQTPNVHEPILTSTLQSRLQQVYDVLSNEGEPGKRYEIGLTSASINFKLFYLVRLNNVDILYLGCYKKNIDKDKG